VEGEPEEGALEKEKDADLACPSGVGERKSADGLPDGAQLKARGLPMSKKNDAWESGEKKL